LMVKTKGHSFCHILVVVLPNLNDSCWWYAPFLLLTIVFVCCIPFIQWFPTPNGSAMPPNFRMCALPTIAFRSALPHTSRFGSLVGSQHRYPEVTEVCDGWRVLDY
jgi:hypothetical protein